VKGVRFPDPRCLPSLEEPHSPPAPKCERSCGTSVDCCGAHVMRIAEPRPTVPFSLGHDVALTRPFHALAEPPFTRSVGQAGFRPARHRWRASSGRETFHRLLQYVRCTGTYRGRIGSSHAAVRGDDPSLALAFGRSLSGTARADELDTTCLRRSSRARTGPTRVKVRAVFRRANPLLEPDRTPPCHARTAPRGGTPLALVPAPGDSLRANARRLTAKVSGPAPPREG